MKIYSVSALTAHEGHTGCQFFTSKAKAEQAKVAHLKDGADSAAVSGPFSVKLTKAGVLSALNLYGGHPDNG